MHFLTIVFSIVFSIFSTAVMSYVSMAMPISPWIGPTIALCVLFLFKLFRYQYGKNHSVALVTVAGSIGGILATGFGFSLPTLYFLDQQLFTTWMANPIYFAAILSGLGLAAGGFGLMIANLIEDKLIVQEQLAFPIGKLIHKLIAAGDQIRKAYELIAGFVGTVLFCFLQDGLFGFKGILSKSFVLIPGITLGAVRIPPILFDIWPLLWATGFITGHVIAIPLVVGVLAKIFLVDPVNTLYFSGLSSEEFVLAFCSGMILCGAAISFIGLPKTLMHALQKLKKTGFTRNNKTRSKGIKLGMLVEIAALTVMPILFLSYFSFSWTAQLYLLLFSFVWTYQIAVIAGKIGLAPLGRFATFVMIPAMLLFPLDFVQIVFIATFVEICGGVAADILFGRKLAHCADINQKSVKAYQYLGLLTSSLSVGIIFWLLINHFHLGSDKLVAYKALNRALLVGVKRFDYYVLIIGALFSFVLKYMKVNPVLVLGGLLMPPKISIGLIFGGMLTLLVKEREEWDPFWSGVFTSNSLWMVIKSILG